MSKAWVWLCEGVATITGIVVAGTIFEVGHFANTWLTGLLVAIVFVGIAAVVEHAVNGPIRLGRALDELEGRLTSKIGELQRSIEQIERKLS